MTYTQDPMQYDAEHSFSDNELKSLEKFLGVLERAETNHESRTSPRMQFEYRQRIAPMHDKLLPTPEEYLDVECNDISRGGISFYLRRPPACKYFAVSLGQKNQTTTVIAKVAYSREVKVNGQKLYLVGCKFVDKVRDD
jgi:hypothetical protein